MDIGTKELRNRLSEVLDRVERGERVIIRRRGRASAELRALPAPARRFPDLASFRAAIKVRGRPGSEVTLRMREEERF